MGSQSPSRAPVPGEAPSDDAATASSTREFVTFQLSGETFAVALTEVQEIIRLPQLVMVPMSPPSLVGLANLRGTVLPVASLRRVFGMTEAPHDDASRVVVVSGGLPIGFVVDRIARVITVDVAEIEEPAAVSASIPIDMVSGVIRRGSEVVLLVSPGALLAREYSRRTDTGQIGAVTSVRNAMMASEPAEDDALDELRFVTFVVDGQEYAFAVENVQEVVTLPSKISRLPNAPAEVLGVITLRERLLALVSLRALFGLPRAAESGQSRIVVVSVRGPDGQEVSVGVVTDTVKEVLRVHRSVMQEVPAALGRSASRNEIDGICQLQNGKRLVSIISANRVLEDAAAVAPAIDSESDCEPPTTPEPRTSPGGDGMADDSENVTMLDRNAQTDALDEDELLVVFRLAGGEYAVPVHAVQEIVRVPEVLTAVPRAPHYMEGIVNLRGAVLPVVDQRTRFGLTRAERNDRQRIMVLLLDGRQTGFIVDSVSEVLKVRRSQIRPAPELSQEQSDLINRVVHMEDSNRVILLIEAARLASQDEIVTLEEAA